MSSRLLGRFFLTVICVWQLGANLNAAQQSTGRIEGRIVRENRTGVEGATVVLSPSQASAISGPNGEFTFDGLSAGSYSVTATLGEQVVTLTEVRVTAGQTATVAEIVDWDVGFTETLEVTATSRRPERIVEAPASVTKVTEGEIAEKAAHSQLPKLVEFAPGAQVTQGGVYDFNLNARGFNSSLNRRVAVLIDGRNPAASFFGAQEWAAVGLPLDDLAGIELVRGPSAALYGANASSGILNITTKEPRYSRGGAVRAAFGQLGTANLDFRWAGALGGDWYGKVLGGVHQSGDFFVSRKGAAEYTVPCGSGVTTNCLPQESIVPARLDDDNSMFSSLRADKYLPNSTVLTMEAGLGHVAGPVVQTGVGRTQVTDVSRSWARFNVNGNHFNVFTAYTGRDAPGQLALSSGTNSTLTSHTLQIEGQTDRSFAGNRVQVVGGASAQIDRINSLDKGIGRQSLVFEPIRSNQQALFGQADWRVAGGLRLVLAGRGDFSSLHEFQFSPKGSAVYTIAPGHSVRITYNEAFQVPNYSEYFLQADAAPPANLTPLNGLCLASGVDCHFGPTRILAVGNRNLEVEKTRTLEEGYKGLIAGRALLTVDYYRSRASNFITDLLPQLGTSLGRINSDFGPWQAPAGLPPAVAAQIRAAAPAILSNNLDGSNILAAVSYTNLGRVDTQGVDLGLNAALPAGWHSSFAYSWFDFTIHNPVPGLDAMLLPNSPDHSVNVGAGYARGRFDADFNFRWVDAFRWSVGPFQGDVPSYTTADLTANYDLPRGLTLGINVANIFDDAHWETFGGDVLRRRALVSIGYRW
jgi:outer membrane receptor protein involved in Fe transport